MVHFLIVMVFPQAGAEAQQNELAMHQLVMQGAKDTNLAARSCMCSAVPQ